MKILTRKELANKGGCPFYLIDYLRSLNRLPILKASTGKGDPNIFAPEALSVLKKYLRKRTGNGS